MRKKKKNNKPEPGIFGQDVFFMDLTVLMLFCTLLSAPVFGLGRKK